MNQFVEMIHSKEAELGVVFPPSVKKAFQEKPMSELVSWEMWKPSAWRLLENISDAHQLPAELSDCDCAITIGSDGAGGVYFLRAISGSRTEIGDAIFHWDHETNDVREVGDSLLAPDKRRALLSEANKLLGDDLEIVDEEDTY